MDERHLAPIFEKFVTDLFRAEGFDVEVEPRGPLDTRPDLIIRSQSGASAVAELKLYRSRVMPTPVLQQAADLVEASRQAYQASKAILVIGNKVSQMARIALVSVRGLLDSSESLGFDGSLLDS
jgi:Restriction endonuclease